jgi:hypothetical protein
MLVLTPDKKNVLTRIDTETGKTLDEIKMRLHAELDEPINTVTHSEKFSQLLSQPVVELAGTSRNTVFDMTWDPREKTDDIIISADNRCVILLLIFTVHSLNAHENKKLFRTLI